MPTSIQAIEDSALDQISKASDSEALEQIRVAFLGKKGTITALLKSVGGLPPDERKQAAQSANVLKDKILAAIHSKQESVVEAALAQQLAENQIDVTLAGEGLPRGHFHPVTRMLQRIHKLFSQAGFQVKMGPELEDDYHNFTALNMPEHHPARAMHDTFYFGDGTLLRTHTSPVQIRAMENIEPPIRMIAPGRVYRCDSDQTHTPMFHQVEGLVIDKNTNFIELRTLLIDFIHALFEDDSLKIRFRPSYFPFTEPSAEVDIQMPGAKNDQWLEILGCGMVHPNVIRHMGLDPDEWRGYAFGLGVERMAMLRYGVTDLRLFFDNNLSFLRQF